MTIPSKEVMNSSSQIHLFESKRNNAKPVTKRKKTGGRKLTDEIEVNGIRWKLNVKKDKSNSDEFRHPITGEQRTRQSLNRQLHKSKLSKDINNIYGKHMIIADDNLDIHSNEKHKFMYLPNKKEDFEKDVLNKNLKLKRMYAILNYFIEKSNHLKSSNFIEREYGIVAISGARLRNYRNDYKSYLDILKQHSIIEMHKPHVFGWQSTSYKVYYNKIEKTSDESGGVYEIEINKALERIAKYKPKPKKCDPIATTAYLEISKRISKYFNGNEGINDKIAIRTALKHLDGCLEKGIELDINSEEIQNLRQLSITDSERQEYAILKSREEARKLEDKDRIEDEYMQSTEETGIDNYEDTRTMEEYYRDMEEYYRDMEELSYE
jgi:hypothetical protein